MEIKNNQHHYDIIAKILNDEEKPLFWIQIEIKQVGFLKIIKCG
ncbi:MAG: hypothetical protein OXI67_04590 [Candidatus Poribacteria bacterium]|nr:hypothetical protein [Candidatus Poribacteria bacterium]